MDKKDLLAYLSGETSTNAAIDTTFESLVAPTTTVAPKHTIPAAADDRQPKKCAALSR